jgi:hypothetical protein
MSERWCAERTNVSRMVPEEGVEPTHRCRYGILSPARLPVPPLRPESHRIAEFGFVLPTCMRRWLVVVLLGLAAIRFSSVAYQSLTLSVGDFYSTLPGAYVEKFNPTLWNSPDFLDEVGKRPSYRRGPTQLLTTLPLSFLNSYKEISRVLLFVYAGLILASAYCMWRSFSASRNR